MIKNFLEDNLVCVVLPWNGFFVNTTEMYYKAHKTALKAVESSRADDWTIDDTNALRKLRPEEVFQLPIWNGKEELAREVFYKTYEELSMRIKLVPEALEFLKELRDRSADDRFYNGAFGIVLLTKKTYHILMKEVEHFDLWDFFDDILGSSDSADEDESTVPAFQRAVELWGEGEIVIIGDERMREYAEAVDAELICLSDDVTPKTLLDAIKN